ncbi:MAG TPA: translation repressor protein [Flavobacteriales bacterium]|nr:translation repressor protein [Flavobacteriales bacterium]
MTEERKVVPVDLNDLVEIELEEQDDFLKIRETLTRVGVASRKNQTLFQSCHILHKKGKYYIVHFKELFALDGKPTNLTENDIARRNTIANLLAEWGLLSLSDAEKSKSPSVTLNQIKIIPFKDKIEWTLESKYNIGKRKF